MENCSSSKTNCYRTPLKIRHDFPEGEESLAADPSLREGMTTVKNNFLEVPLICSLPCNGRFVASICLTYGSE